MDDECACDRCRPSFRLEIPLSYAWLARLWRHWSLPAVNDNRRRG
jgi:hypothetical protein